MLVDRLRIDFKAGKGGDGFVSFAKYGRSLGKNGNLYYPKKGKPDGGNGGKGGDIFLEGSHDIYDLKSFVDSKTVTAGDGMKGLSIHKQGRSGTDTIIKVPLTTVITDIHGKTVLTITKHMERKLLIRGGMGGLGNYEFRAGQLDTLFKHTEGEYGEGLKGFIELRLSADIVFIGFPNAGKSSMLNALTEANVKVASYPFTTLEPQLGIMAGTVRLMDLPGLIEGVAEGRGLGKSFNKHTLSAVLLAHFISAESEDFENTYLSLRTELSEFSETLSRKEEVIIITKSDIVSREEIEKKLIPLQKYNRDILIVSVYDHKEVEIVRQYFINILNTFNSRNQNEIRKER